MVYNNGNQGNNTGNGQGSSYADINNGDDDGTQFSFQQSNYQFTDPIRYFKSNDPYYWEVDNIPLKQLQENCLWLQDQIGSGGGGSVGNISRTQFEELRPYVDGLPGRKVFVKPGKFIGRVNDAYGTGNRISDISVFQGPHLWGMEQHPPESGKYRPSPNSSEYRMPPRYKFNLPNEVLYKIVGSGPDGTGGLDTARLGFNGLYDFVQHYNSYLTTAGRSLRYTEGTDYDQTSNQPPVLEVNDIPTIRTALWKHGETADTFFDLDHAIDLQTLAVEFTKRWGGVARTAVVNVPNELSIQIPFFDPDDYMDNGVGVAEMRIDLVFIYTHPIDQKATNIVKGDSVQTINEPVLGLIKGAGLILKPGIVDGPDPANTPSDIEDAGEHDYFITKPQTTEGTPDIAKSLLSPLADQHDSFTAFPNHPGGEPRGVFPLPDDLMNLAPLLVEDLADDHYNLIGQSILPICYVITRAGDVVGDGTNPHALLMTDDIQDIIDIRPFFRTAELTYNERAGIAAANPPLSFANQAVGARQLQEYIRNLRTTIDDDYNFRINDLVDLVGEATHEVPSIQPVAYGKLHNGNYPGQNELHVLRSSPMDMQVVETEVLKPMNSPAITFSSGQHFTLKRGKYEIEANWVLKFDPHQGNRLIGAASQPNQYEDWIQCKFVLLKGAWNTHNPGNQSSTSYTQYGNMENADAIAAYFDHENAIVGATDGVSTDYNFGVAWSSTNPPNTSWDLRQNPDMHGTTTAGRAANSAFGTHTFGGKIILTVDDEDTTPAGVTPGWNSVPRDYRFAVITPTRMDNFQGSYFMVRMWGTFKIERISDVDGNPGLHL